MTEAERELHGVVAAKGPARLEVRSLSAGYGELVVLHNATLSLRAGSVTALLGPNGAGKTTLLRAITGLISAVTGQVCVDGRDVTQSDPTDRAKRGLCLVPEGRGVFRQLTVRENLRMFRPPWVQANHAHDAIEAFPVLRHHMDQVAGAMSGGEQQMLALARAFMAEPSVVLLDEVSMGLAPVIVDQLFVALEALSATGVAMLLVEQYVHRALKLADQVVLIDRGRISFTGPSDRLDDGNLIESYLGMGIE
jgi:branched-chain amino acid transport system ATP-binding protein